MILKEKYLITGATGLIGAALVKKIATGGAEIICPVRSVEKAKTMFDPISFEKVQWIETSLESFLEDVSEDYDYIIHCASPTASRFFVEHPVETMRFSIDTTTLILDYAKNHRLKGIVYLSSLESYGTIIDDTRPITEEVQGYVNLVESRSSYNMAKRICESLCHAYAEEYNVPVKVIRLTQTISPYFSENDMRVFVQFSRYAANGEDIELHTDGTAARQYIYIEDAVDAVLCVLKKGKAGEIYNAAREDSYISVRKMAKFVQDNFNPQGKVVYNLRDDMGYANTTKLRLSTEKLEKLGWNAKYDLYEMYNQVISCLKNSNIMF